MYIYENEQLLDDRCHQFNRNFTSAQRQQLIQEVSRDEGSTEQQAVFMLLALDDTQFRARVDVPIDRSLLR